MEILLIQVIMLVAMCVRHLLFHHLCPKYLVVQQSQLRPPVPGSTLGNRLPSDVMGSSKTHINPLWLFASDSCYVHSAILALAFHLATVTATMCGAMHFRHSTIIQQRGDSCLPLNIWQRTIKKDTKKVIIST